MAISFIACKDDAPDPGFTCDAGSNFLFEEAGSIVLVEFETATFESDWELVSDKSNFTGLGYMRWDGSNSFGTPGKGLASYKIKINNPGTYRFIWRSAVKEGTSGTESNDSWLRFADASNFYAEKSSGSIVYPKGTGKTPNPEGASADGWFKVYRSGNDLDFKWQANTSDNDAHQIFVKFDAVAIYTMEISGRSKGHAIDKFVLYKVGDFTEAEATSFDIFSVVSCE